MAYAVNPHGCRKNLQEGMTDGAYKKAAPHRSGIIEDTFAEVRRQMSPVWHGFNNVRERMLPDGRQVDSPYYIDVSPVYRGDLV